MLKQQTRFPIWQSLAVSLAGSMLMLADDEFNHSRVRHLVQQHFWLIIFLPMVLFVLFMFARFYYLEYKN